MLAHTTRLEFNSEDSEQNNDPINLESQIHDSLFPKEIDFTGTASWGVISSSLLPNIWNAN